MKLKAWHHASLAVDDLEQSIAFYIQAFGMEIVFSESGLRDEIASMTGQTDLACNIAMLRSPLTPTRLELIQFIDAGPPLELPLRTGAGHIAFEVENLDAALSAVIALGAKPIGHVTSFPEGRATYCREPGGSFFELEELTDTRWSNG